ncbi:MAG: hypothetical protein QM734_14755 [Cyclobacteriaceae bacterium]
MALSFSGKKDDGKNLVIATAAEDELGNIWFGDLDEGLILFDAKTQQFSKPIEKVIGSYCSLPEASV